MDRMLIADPLDDLGINTTRVSTENVRDLMNKLTSTNKKEIIEEFMIVTSKWIISSGNTFSKEMDEVVDVVIDAAVKNPTLSGEYAEICKSRVDFENDNCYNCSDWPAEVNEHYRSIAEKKSITFQDSLESRFRHHLQKTYPSRSHKFKSAIKELRTTNFHRLEALLSDEDEFCMRKYAFMRFLGHLYNKEVVGPGLVCSCLCQYTSHIKDYYDQKPISPPYDEESLRSVALLLEMVGRSLEDSFSVDGFSILNRELATMKQLAPKCTVKTRCQFLGLALSRSKNWIRNIDLPRTIADVQEEVQEMLRESDQKHIGAERRNNEEWDQLREMLNDFSLSLKDLGETTSHSECSDMEEEYTNNVR